MTDVGLGEFILRHVDGDVAPGPKFPEKIRACLSRPESHADEDVCLRRVAVAVVEFGNVVVAEDLAEPFQTPGTLRDGGREKRLALLTAQVM